MILFYEIVEIVITAICTDVWQFWTGYMLFGIQLIHQQTLATAVFLLASGETGTGSKPSPTVRHSSSEDSNKKPTDEIHSI